MKSTDVKQPAMDWEKHALKKFPRRGNCPKSAFAIGWHRVGIVPIASILDGGVPGMRAVEVCLDCGKIFDEPRWFVAKRQPSKPGGFVDDRPFHNQGGISVGR